jgi:hypothetical protein
MERLIFCNACLWGCRIVAFFQDKIEGGKTPGSIQWSLGTGPVAFGVDLGATYVFRMHACSSSFPVELRIVPVCACLLALSGLLAGLIQFRRLPHDAEEKGGQPHDRAHFQSLLGVALSGAFAVGIVALAMPGWLLQPCQ